MFEAAWVEHRIVMVVAADDEDVRHLVHGHASVLACAIVRDRVDAGHGIRAPAAARSEIRAAAGLWQRALGPEAEEREPAAAQQIVPGQELCFDQELRAAASDQAEAQVRLANDALLDQPGDQVAEGVDILRSAAVGDTLVLAVLAVLAGRRLDGLVGAGKRPGLIDQDIGPDVDPGDLNCGCVLALGGRDQALEHDPGAILEDQQKIIAGEREIGAGGIELDHQQQAGFGRHHQRLTGFRPIHAGKSHRVFAGGAPRGFDRRFQSSA